MATKKTKKSKKKTKSAKAQVTTGKSGKLSINITVDKLTLEDLLRAKRSPRPPRPPIRYEDNWGRVEK